MADIFISYAHADRMQAERLCAFLEEHGYTVWFDRSLRPAEDFSAEILRQLDLARVVIVLWSGHSVGSQFVRAEAQKARSENKLLPIAAPGLDRDTIPLPYNTLETPAADPDEALLAHFETVLARPRQTGSRVWSFCKGEVLLFAGVLGTAMTVFVGCSALLELADWAAWIVATWRGWTAALYGWLAEILSIGIPEEIHGGLTFALFLTVLTGSVLLQAPRVCRRSGGDWRLLYFGLGGLVASLAMFLFTLGYWWLEFPAIAVFSVSALACFLGLSDNLSDRRNLPFVALSFGILIIFGYVVTRGDFGFDDLPPGFGSIGPAIERLILWAIFYGVSFLYAMGLLAALMFMAPIRLVARRLVFSFLLVVALLVLNMVSVALDRMNDTAWRVNVCTIPSEPGRSPANGTGTGTCSI